ncbi:unnamed protein product [Adineta steineri]|uniref:FHA domain-containing protein n=1 Tax=Adineta steineri TaxID=433720 RepID=A0A814V6M3_9BILA|nr:unnamed protein product [Adineta steineri]CAF1553223.1 unnamed protein product [Adineta steineri]
MKGLLYSQDGAYAFPLGPKVTTVGRDNCDISINSPNVDNQHGLIEYDDEQRCFILKDLNSSSGTYVHDCRVQNAAVRLSNGDIIRFGCNGLPLEFRIEQIQETTMPSIYQRQAATNSLQLISQTIPSRRAPNGITNQQQQIDVTQNPGFSLRTRPSSVGSKRTSSILTNPNNQDLNMTRDSHVRTNAWTINSTSNNSRNMINGSFVGELDISSHDNMEITNRVDQLEKEVKGRDAEIRGLNDRLRSLEPVSSTFTNEVRTLKNELEKVKREKQAASGLITNLQRDLLLKESDVAKLTREIEGMKSDSRDKDLRLQSLQAKLNLLRDRNRAEEDRYTKEKELKMKVAEQQINELNESVNRLKSQLQDTETQLLRLNQNEQKLKQECEDARGQLVELQRNETTLKTNLENSEKKHNEFCTNIWKCFSTDDDDDYDEDQHNLVEQIQQLKQQLDQSRIETQQQRDTHAHLNEELRNSLAKFIDMLKSTMQEQTTSETLLNIRQQMIDLNENAQDGTLVGMFKQTAINIIDYHTRLISEINNLVVKREDQQGELPVNETLALIRRQYEDLEREKQSLSLEHTSHEDSFRSEMEKITAEKDAFWQQHYNDECNRLREENVQAQNDYDEQIRSLSDRLETATSRNSEYLQQWNTLQIESSNKIDELTTQLHECQRQLTEEKEQQYGLTDTHERQKEEYNQLEKEKNATIDELNAQLIVYRGQVQQFSKTIVQFEKNLTEEQEKRLKLQTELDAVNKKVKGKPPTPPVSVEKIVPVLMTTSVADVSNEVYAHKTRIQEQEQIIISLRRDLAGLNARLSDVNGELTDKQKRALEKSDTTIRDQTKELNTTRVKLSKLSDVVDKQSAKIESLQTDLAKSKTLANQYQLLVDQRQNDIDRLTQNLEQKTSIVDRVERTHHDEGRVTHEFVAIGAQCKGERHEQTIERQRQALNELRARMKSIEQLRPANPSYEKTLQQVVSLKRELAEIRARQALPIDIPFLTAPASNSIQHQSATMSSQTLTAAASSGMSPEAQKIIEERTAHAETMNTLQSCDELYNTFTRKLVRLLDIDDDTLLNTSPLSTVPANERYLAIQQRQRIIDILLQKLEVLHDRLTRKEDLLKDYERDLGKLRQAEIILREKNILVQDLQTDKQIKDDETLFLRNSLRETQDTLNQEKRVNSSIKLGRNIDQVQPNELIRRNGGSATTLHHHCPPDINGKIHTVKRDMNEKINRKNYEIKTLKQELHEALDTLSEQSHKVKVLELQSMDISNGTIK